MSPKEVILKYISLTEAWTYMASVDSEGNKDAMKILSDKLSALVKEYPHLLIPDMTLSLFVKNLTYDAFIRDGGTEDELSSRFVRMLHKHLSATVSQRMEEFKEFEKKGKSIINEAINIIGRIEPKGGGNGNK